jgi:hypothetical protein
MANKDNLQSVGPQGRAHVRGPVSSPDVQKPFEDAYVNYLRALKEACAPEDVRVRFDQAYRDYIAAIQNAGGDEFKRFEAYWAYTRTRRDLWPPEERQRRLDEAYRNYVQALKDAWSKTDPNSQDIHMLAAIAQSITNVASYAASSRVRAGGPGN